MKRSADWLASYCGDRLRLGSPYCVIPPEEIKHSRMSGIVSIVTIALGSIFIVTTILRHCRALQLVNQNTNC